MMGEIVLSPTDMMRMLRQHLAAHLPNIGFQMSWSEVTKGEAILSVRWFSGPTEQDVSALCEPYARTNTVEEFVRYYVHGPTGTPATREDTTPRIFSGLAWCLVERTSWL